MMKDYLIESMTSYMRKLDMPAQRNSVHLKKLKESFGDDPMAEPSPNRYINGKVYDSSAPECIKFGKFSR